MIELTINGIPVAVPPSTTVLAAARQLGISIPTLCHVEGFEPAASCFLCAVKIHGRPGFSPSCALPAATGMNVTTDSDEIRKVRKTALELLLSDHVGDCIGPCRTGCPARLDIPQFISRVASGDADGAADVVVNDLALPRSLGRICPRLCEQRCRQCEVDESLSIRNLHRFAGDQQPAAAASFLGRRAAPSGKRIAIVGTGPAGLTAAFRLLLNGHQITLFDSHPLPGGMLRYGIPSFRLPRNVLDEEISAIRQLGGEFRLGHRLGRDFTLEQLRRQFDAVFLAIGAQGSRGLGCPGDELALPALEFLAQLTDGPVPSIGDDVIVVGGGNTAMDAARCAVRLGAASVRVLYRRTRNEMPCLMEEVEAAEAEGVQIEYLVAPLRLHRGSVPSPGRVRSPSGPPPAPPLSLTCQRMELGPPDDTGRPRPIPIPGSEFDIPATCVIAAIGQSVDSASLDARELTLTKWGIAVDPATLATNLPGVFAGGDAVTGPDLAVRAVAAGKLAATSIEQYLAGQKIVGAPEWINVVMGKLTEDELALLLRDVERRPRAPMPHLPLDQRKSTFNEVELGFSPSVAADEARRCLGCGCAKAIPCRLRRYATEYHVDPQHLLGERRRFARDDSHPDILFEPGKCILCGACVQVAAQAGEPWGVSFVGRGFQASVLGPFHKSAAEAFRHSGNRAAEVCPTGAITLKANACATCRFS